MCFYESKKSEGNKLRVKLKWILLFLLITGSVIKAADAKEWQLVADESNVRFIGALEGAPFRGRFDVFSATIDFDPQDPESGKITGVVKMSSADSGDAEYDAYLMEEDWFNPAQYVNSKFISNTIESLNNGKYAAHGELTIVGISQPVTMVFEFNATDTKAEFSGSFEIKRLLFGIGWEATNWVADDVSVQVELELVQ